MKARSILESVRKNAVDGDVLFRVVGLRHLQSMRESGAGDRGTTKVAIKRRLRRLFFVLQRFLRAARAIPRFSQSRTEKRELHPKEETCALA